MNERKKYNIKNIKNNKNPYGITRLCTLIKKQIKIHNT